MRWPHVVVATVLVGAGLAIWAETAQAQEACVACHSKVEAKIEVLGRVRSVRLDLARFTAGKHQDNSCDTCHSQDAFKTYPHKLGRSVDAVIREANQTCGDCHDEVASKFKTSAHGSGKPKWGKPLPVCSSCHNPHDPVDPQADAFQASIPGTCNQCHNTRYDTYLDTYHGKATVLGRVAVAQCSDCHTAHQNLPASNPASSVNPRNLVTTCQKCHPQATPNFASFRVHVDVTSPKAPPILFAVNLFYTVLIGGVFALGGLHAILYAWRGWRSGLYRRRKNPHA